MNGLIDPLGLDQIDEGANNGSKWVKANMQDPAADALAKKLGGESSVIFPGKFKDKEFDILTDKFIGETKPANFKLGSSWRNQAKLNFEAAKELNLTPYFHFDGAPASGVINKINEYSLSLIHI